MRSCLPALGRTAYGTLRMRMWSSWAETSHMNNRLVWIGILIVLVVTIATIANCRKFPDPWVPQVEGDGPPPTATAEE